MSNAYAIITDIPAKTYEVKDMKNRKPACKIKFIKLKGKTPNRYGKGMYGRGMKRFTKRIRRRELYDVEPTPEMREAMRQTEEIIAAWEKLHEGYSSD